MFERRRQLAILVVPQASRLEAETFWQPPVDIFRTDYGWLLKFELAGVRLEDLTISLHGNCITVQGVRRDLTAHEVCSYYSMEIAYNEFRRTVQLPRPLEGSDVNVEFRDGLLLVRICERGGKP